MDDRLLEALRMKVQDDKRSNLEYYITNINPQIFNTSPNSLTQVSIEVASWHHLPNIKICKVCNGNLVKDEYHALITFSSYKVICEKYDDLLDMHDNMSVILTFLPTRVSMCVLYFHVKSF